MCIHNIYGQAYLHIHTIQISEEESRNWKLEQGKPKAGGDWWKEGSEWLKWCNDIRILKIESKK